MKNYTDLAKTYSENEGENRHYENLVLLAENFGTQTDLLLAQSLLEYRRSGAAHENNRTNFDQLEEHLWSKIPQAFKDAYNQNGEDDDE